MYYRASKSNLDRKLNADVRDVFVKDLDNVKQILYSQYPECSPVKKLLAKIDLAIESLKSWN